MSLNSINTFEFCHWLLYIAYERVGKKKIVIDIIVSAVCGIVAVILIKQKYDPYIPFCVIAGTVVGFIQSNIMYRKTEKLKIQSNWAESVLAIMRLVAGVVVLVVPYTNIFYTMLLEPCVKVVHTLCYIIYAFWGIGEVGFSIITLYLVKKYDNDI